MRERAVHQSASRSFFAAVVWLFLLSQHVATAFVAPQLPSSSITTATVIHPVTQLTPASLNVRYYDRKGTALSASFTGVASSRATAQDDDTPAPSPTRTTTARLETGSKLRQLKDLMWVREALEDLTAAEFACTVEAAGGGNKDESAPTRPSKRAVDYEKLLDQLNRRVTDMGCPESSNRQSEISCALQPGVGMGSIVYTDEQRQSLLEQILRTRSALLEVIRGHEVEFEVDNLPFQITLPELPEIRVEIPKEQDDPTSPGPKLYVRDDGTVDWDGALQDQAALRKFGTAVWARINGRDPESLEDGALPEPTEGHGGDEKSKEVMAKIRETPQIREARVRLDDLSNELKDAEDAHVKLLSSAISAGQPVANVNLATLEPAERSRIRESADALEKMKEEVSFQTLVYELERIYSYLLGELGNPAITGYIPLQDRLTVAEFGLLESQIDSFHIQLDRGDSLDSDVLAVVMDQLTDFKRRLGIDYYVTGLSFDGEAIRRWLGELLEKTRKGLAFYGKGLKLFWNDIVFSLSLINRAAQGYTLKPREVRTIRRTFKDVITFIPVVVILLIPLSPVGHVLVFGAIQRFWPGFFPSCFTEQRQNLLQLYENAEYSEMTISENWKEKLARLSEATVFFFVNQSRSLYLKLTGKKDEGDQGANDTEPVDGENR